MASFLPLPSLGPEGSFRTRIVLLDFISNVASQVALLQPRVLGNKLIQKDNADSGVQFITPAGPGQSLLLAKDPDQFL